MSENALRGTNKIGASRRFGSQSDDDRGGVGQSDTGSNSQLDQLLLLCQVRKCPQGQVIQVSIVGWSLVESEVVALAEKYGKWPGVVAIVGDADRYRIPCAQQRYGKVPLQAVIDGERGYEQYTDHSRNPLGAVFYGSEDVHGMYCGGCGAPLCDEDCLCYQPGQAEYWNRYGTFFAKSEGEVEDE